MKSLLDAAREACSPEVWSIGVQLARSERVSREAVEPDRVTLRVKTQGGMFSPTVVLYPEDLDWECNCPNRCRTCEHVVAAVIALSREQQEGRGVPSTESVAGRVVYRFVRNPGGLSLDRAVLAEDGERRLESSLAAIASRRLDGPAFVATQVDLQVELILGTHRRGVLPRALVPRLLAALAKCRDVKLDGAPVSVSAIPLRPLAVLEDQGEGFRLWVRDDPSMTEAFANGIALCDGTLRPIAETRLTGREIHELPSGRHYRAGQAAELVTEVLPSLSKRVPVEILTDRLPPLIQEVPRIAFDLSRDGTALEVLATLVYGDPPRARVDGGRLILLGGSVPMRDLPMERALLRRLAHELGLAPGVRARLEAAEAVSFTERLAGWDYRPISSEIAFFRRRPALAPRVIADENGFDVLFEIPLQAEGGRGGASRADPLVVLGAWRSGDSLVPLLDGGWSALPADWLARFGDRVADLLAARDSEGRIPRGALFDLARLCDDLEQPRPPSFEPLSVLARDFSTLPVAALPADLAAELRPYQRDGVNWLCFLRTAGLGALLADDMGLGKTIQALCAVQGRTLVVAPASVLHNWAAEVRRFRPALRPAVYHGDRRSLDRSADITLTTYAILRLDADRLAAEAWDTILLDEAQTIKNPDSQVAQAAYALQGRFRIVLSGTPVENRLDELWSQFHFINRGLLGGRSDFLERYVRPIATGIPGSAEHLRERIRPFVLRRLKREVAPELPPRTELELRCQLTVEEREVYDTVRAAALQEVVVRLRKGGSVLAALEALLRLRQAACHSGLVPGREAESSSKVRLLMETLDTVVAESHKALVFSQWTSLLDRVEPHLEASGIGFTRLDGSTRDREAVVSRFQDEAGPPVLLVSLKAGGQGLNLTAADHVFLLDPWWNPATEDQAADRAHRLGQERPVMIYRLVAEDTVEERILELQKAKRELADTALGGADRAASLTRDDLLALLE